MTKFFATLLFTVFSACSVFAQKEVFIDPAFYNFHHGNYPRAIILYKQLIAKTHYTYQMQLLAMCYAKMDSIQQEKEVLEKVIDMPPKKFDNGIASGCCRTLADLYLKEKNYPKALSLYNLYGVLWKQAGFADVNTFAFNLDKENARSKCFEGLHIIDSAVNILTPYIFCTYKDLRYNNFSKSDLKDSLAHDSVCARYLTLLKKLHSNKSIKAELEKAETNFHYTETMTHPNNFFWKNMTCGFVFYTIDIVFGRYGIGDSTEEKVLAYTRHAPYTKAYQLQRFHILPLYRMIRNLPD